MCFLQKWDFFSFLLLCGLKTSVPVDSSTARAVIKGIAVVDVDVDVVVGVVDPCDLGKILLLLK